MCFSVLASLKYFSIYVLEKLLWIFQCWQVEIFLNICLRMITVNFFSVGNRLASLKYLNYCMKACWTHNLTHMKYKQVDTLIGQFSSQQKIWIVHEGSQEKKRNILFSDSRSHQVGRTNPNQMLNLLKTPPHPYRVQISWHVNWPIFFTAKDMKKTCFLGPNFKN